MFVLTKDLVVKREVKIPVPVEPRGYEPHLIRVHFRILNDDEMYADPTQEEVDVAKALNLPPPGKRVLNNAELLKKALVGWEEEDVRESKAEGAATIPFSAAARDMMIQLPYAVPALVAAYAEAAGGARLKN